MLTLYLAGGINQYLLPVNILFMIPWTPLKLTPSLSYAIHFRLSVATPEIYTTIVLTRIP
jgi:hypothetical protein